MTAGATVSSPSFGQTVSDAIRNIKKKLKELFNGKSRQR